jgi:hypothetical protein
MWTLRRVLNKMNPIEAMELLLQKLEKTETNAEFLSKFIISGVSARSGVHCRDPTIDPPAVPTGKVTRAAARAAPPPQEDLDGVAGHHGLPGRADVVRGLGTLALVNAGLAQGKNRSGFAWFVASLFVGPIATLLIVVLDPAPKSAAR